MTALLTIKEAAAFLRVSPNTLRRHLGDGSLPIRWFKVGGAIRITADSLDHWLETADGTADISLPRHHQ